MADNDSPQSKGDTTLECIPTNLLPPQSAAPPEALVNMTASQNGAAPQTFHRFPELPPELRIAIWELALPHQVYEFPCPSMKFNCLALRWEYEQANGPKGEGRPVIAQVCYEARTVALANGSVRKAKFFDTVYRVNMMSHAWVDSKRDTAVLKLGHLCDRANWKLYRNLEKDHMWGLLVNREMHIALDSRWTLCICTLVETRARKLYYDLVHGHKECDIVILDLHFKVTDEEAANTALFGNSVGNETALVPIEDMSQMSRLFDVHAKFNTMDWLNKWDHFTQFRKPANLAEYIERWKKLAVREMRHVQMGLDFLTGVEVRRVGQDADELRRQAARAATIRADQPKLRPVVMVFRDAPSPL